MSKITGDDISKPEYSDLLFLLGLFVWAVVMIPASAWVLRIKNRSFWWLIFSFFWFTVPVILLLRYREKNPVFYENSEKAVGI